MTTAERTGTGMTSDRNYTFILPPGWFRIDLRLPLAPQVQQLTDAVLDQESAGSERSRLRVGLINQMTRACEAARADHVLDLVLPVGLVEGRTLPVSWAFMPLVTRDGTDPIELLAAIASRNESAALIEIRDLVALRIESRSPKSTAQLSEAVQSIAVDLGESPSDTLVPDSVHLWTQRVQYFLGHPQRPDSWIVVAASITDTGGDDSEILTPALVELFDEVAKTVRFPNA